MTRYGPIVTSNPVVDLIKAAEERDTEALDVLWHQHTDSTPESAQPVYDALANLIEGGDRGAVNILLDRFPINPHKPARMDVFSLGYIAIEKQQPDIFDDLVAKVGLDPKRELSKNPVFGLQNAALDHRDPRILARAFGQPLPRGESRSAVISAYHAAMFWALKRGNDTVAAYLASRSDLWDTATNPLTMTDLQRELVTHSPAPTLASVLERLHEHVEPARETLAEVLFKVVKNSHASDRGGKITCLLQHGANPHVIPSPYHQGTTSFFVAARRNDSHAIQHFADHGCPPTAADDGGAEIMRVALVNGHIDALQTLIGAGLTPFVLESPEVHANEAIDPAPGLEIIQRCREMGKAKEIPDIEKPDAEAERPSMGGGWF